MPLAMNAANVLGFWTGVLAIVVDSVADEQLQPYRASAGDEAHSRLLVSGNARRHPNYCGECASWGSAGLAMATRAGVLRKEPAPSLGALAMGACFSVVTPLVLSPAQGLPAHG